MALVTPEIYRLLLRDYVPEGHTINNAVSVAEQLLQEELNRKFPTTIVASEIVTAYYDNKERYYQAFPTYMPVTNIVTSGWTIGKYGHITTELVGTSLVFNLENYGRQEMKTTIAYTGGWTSVTAPRNLQLAISKLAQNIIRQFDPAGNVVPSGVKSTSMGTLRVDFGEITGGKSVLTSDVMVLARGFRRVIV